jgi:transcriptional regulator with XRE-family HTH domain
MDLSTRQGRREQGLLIQRAVEQAGLSVEDLATRIGCSRALIYQYLSGTTLAQPDRLQLIARETGVPLSYFFDGEMPAGPGAETPEARRPIADSIRRLEELSRYQASPPDWQAVASTSEQIISLAAQAGEAEARGGALLALGQARIRMGDFSRATAPLSEAVEIFSQLGNSPAEVDARQTLGHAYLSTGRISEARAQFSLVAASERWQARWSGAVSLAAVAEQAGDYREAMAKCDEAAAIIDEEGAPGERARGMLYVHANRVNLYVAGGDFRSARALAQQCLVEAEAQGNSDQHLEARLNLALCAYWLGEWSQAHRELTGAIQLARFLADKGREAMARAALAILLAAMCDCEPSIEQAKDALAAALSQGDHRAELFAQLALTDAYYALDRDSEARYHANQALAVANALRLPLYEVEARLRVARLALRLHDFEEARDSLGRALASAERLGARHLAADGQLVQGEWRLLEADAAGAMAAAERAVRLASEMELRPMLWHANGLLARAAMAKAPADCESAVAASERAVLGIEAEREQLRDAGIADTMLEDRQRLELYRIRVECLNALGRDAEARDFIESAAWPPLAAGREEKGGRGKAR